MEKTYNLPNNHEISIGVGANGGFGYGYTTDEQGNIGGLHGFSVGESLYGINQRGHGHGYGHHGHGGGHGHGSV